MSALPVVSPPLPVKGPTSAEPLASPPPLPPPPRPVDLAVVGPSSAAPATKAALEGLLKARRLQAEAPPLRGEARATPLPTGICDIDDLLRGGFPRGQMSEVHGPASSGRTGLLLSAVAQATRAGELVAWVDPGDRFDPASAAGAGADLERLLWLRGRRGLEAEARVLAEAVSSLATLLGSGLFAILVLDLAGFSERELRRLPATTWVRLQRAVAPTRSALVLIADAHVAMSPLGAVLALRPQGPRFSGTPGPGRLLTGLSAFAEAGPYARRHASFALQTV
jgi:hypothetical protein